MINIINRLIESGTFTEDGYKYTLDLGFDGTWMVYRTPVNIKCCKMPINVLPTARQALRASCWL